MRTSADEVSIHALSPESTFAASSACPSEARASTAATASDERTHQYPAAKDRCLLSIVPPCEIQRSWSSNGGATTRCRGSIGNRRVRARRQEEGCLVSRRRPLFVQHWELDAGAQPPEGVAVPERDVGGGVAPRAGADSAGDRRAGVAADGPRKGRSPCP